MTNTHPMSLMLEYFMGVDHAPAHGNGERFPEMEQALRQAKSRPNALVAWWRACKEQQARAETLALWAQLSPHMLNDIGIRCTSDGGFEAIPMEEVDAPADHASSTPSEGLILLMQPRHVDETAHAA